VGIDFQEDDENTSQMEKVSSNSKQVHALHGGDAVGVSDVDLLIN